jgi:hypothetical protein
MKGFNETRKVVGEDLNGIWKGSRKSPGVDQRVSGGLGYEIS